MHAARCTRVPGGTFFLHRWRANGGGYKSCGSSCVRACSNYLFSRHPVRALLAPGRRGRSRREGREREKRDHNGARCLSSWTCSLLTTPALRILLSVYPMSSCRSINPSSCWNTLATRPTRLLSVRRRPRRRFEEHWTFWPRRRRLQLRHRNRDAWSEAKQADAGAASSTCRQRCAAETAPCWPG